MAAETVSVDEDFGVPAGEAVGRRRAVAGEAGRAAELAVAVGVHVVAVVADAVVRAGSLRVQFAGAALAETVTTGTRVCTSSAEAVRKHDEAALAYALARG